MENYTQEIFESWAGFLKQVKVAFGVLDEQQEAICAIQLLQQKGSTVAYTRDFQRYSTNTEWNDLALRNQYYQGLKEYIKDKLLCKEKSKLLKALIEQAEEIDNCFYKRA